MLAIAKEARQRGHQITVYCTSWEGDHEKNINIQLISSRGWNNASRMRNFSQDLEAVLPSENFDLVVGFNKWPGLDLYYAADSCFAHKAYRERGFWYRMTPRARCYLAFEEAVFGSNSDTDILEVSTQERDNFIAFYRTPAERFHTLPPGISRDRVAPENWAEVRAETRQALGISEQQKLLLALGSGFRTKGLDRSISVVKMLSEYDARLFVVGDDNKKPFMKLAQQNQVQDKVVFLGGRSDIPALLQAGDVLIHPAYKENTGNALLEAMIAGLPVVTTDVCGYAHYVASAEMGEVIATKTVEQPFEENEFAAAIKRVLATNTETWHKLGAAFAMNSDIYHRPQVAVDIIEHRASAG
jgi:UDP-glucose:(heptosyl)LPS alpha-1,3-glucosyltransferase